MQATETETAIQILLVDDEENILRSLKRLLMNEDYDILTTTSGEEALTILNNTPEIALIISDQRMPGLTGVDFLEKAMKIAPDATRIILTGYADVHAAIDGINKGGAYRYITKPWKDDELVQIVNEAVLRSALIKDNKMLMGIVKKQNEELKGSNSRLECMVQEQTIELQKQNDQLHNLNANLKNNFKNTIFSLANLIEIKDSGSVSHSRNVTELSTKIARQMGLTKTEGQFVTVAALLHDIGKIGMPDVLLARNFDQMSLEEKAVYAQHPVRGQIAIDSIEDLREVGLIIRHHHESFNGSGFPDKLSGDNIPLGSRIIAIADFIDRKIRELKSNDAVERTLKQVKENLGKRFDDTLYPMAETHAAEMYAGVLEKTDVTEMELQPDDLRPGMVLTKEVRSGTGVLILCRGTLLNENKIESLRRSCRIDPSKSGIFVNIERS